MLAKLSFIEANYVRINTIYSINNALLNVEALLATAKRKRTVTDNNV